MNEPGLTKTAPSDSQPQLPEPFSKQVDLQRNVGDNRRWVDVCVTREKAWLQWLAYEASLQVCIKAVVEGFEDAYEFLKNNSLVLKEAFECNQMLLQPVSLDEQNNSEGGARIAWSEFAQTRAQVAIQDEQVLQVGVAAFTRSEGFKGNCSLVHISLGTHSISAALDTFTARKVLELTGTARAQHLSVDLVGPTGVSAAHSISVDALWKSLEQARTQPASAVGTSSFSSFKRGFKKEADDFELLDSPTIVHYAVQMTTQDNKRVGKVVLALTFGQQAPSVQSAESSYGGSISVSTWQVYETVLAAGLAQQNCRPRALTLGGPWRWLLKEMAVAYGVRPTFAALAFLQWVAAPSRMTPTVDCLTLLTSELRPLMRTKATLLPEEGNMLMRVSEACEELLALTFENYHSLSDNESSGMLSGSASGPESPALALPPAVRLFGVLKDEGDPKDQAWLKERLSIAAGKRYQRLHRNTVKRITENGYQTDGKPNGQTMPVGGCGSETAEEAVAYRRLEALCESIRAEIDNDFQISDHAIFPETVDLIHTTAPKYCKELVAKIEAVLRDTAPQLPSSVAVDLMLAVSHLQDYVQASISTLEDRGVTLINSPRLFGAHIHRWFTDSKVRLCNMCIDLEDKSVTSRNRNGPPVLPLVPAMLEAMDGEMAGYQRLIVNWPQFGPLLEASMCAALQDAIAATARQCGLVQKVARVERSLPPPTPPITFVPTARESSPRKLFGRKTKTLASPPRPQPALPPVTPPQRPALSQTTKGTISKQLPWQWHAPSDRSADAGSASVVQAGVAPHEAKLLNSLRLLLSAAPAMEAAIRSWCREGRTQRLRLLRSSGGSSPRAPTMDAVAEEGDNATDGETGHLDTDFDPELGSHFLQVVGELRSKYAVAIKLAAQRLTDAIFSQPGAAPCIILDKLYGASSSATDLQQPQWQRIAQPEDLKLSTQQQVAPLLEIFGETVAELGSTVDDRVLVALTRGLWDLTAREIYEYLEGLRESHADTKNAWRRRKNAAQMLDQIDSFFDGALSAGPAAGWSGSGVASQHDLARPLHSEKAHILLATNTTVANSSFNVF